MAGHSMTVAQLLTNAGPGVSALTTRHRWPTLFFAVWSGNSKLVRDLMRTPARRQVNMVDRRVDGSEWTPLTLAVCKAEIPVVQTLYLPVNKMLCSLTLQ